MSTLIKFLTFLTSALYCNLYSVCSVLEMALRHFFQTLSLEMALRHFFQTLSFLAVSFFISLLKRLHRLRFGIKGACGT